MRAFLTLLWVLAALTACKRQDMYTQDRAQTWDANLFFRNHTTMQNPVPGTVPHTPPDRTQIQPTTIDAKLLTRGQQRFDIFCTPCHGRAGDGQGMIVQRGFTQPPSLTQGKLRTAKADLFYKTITEGYGAMYSFADRVPPSDRWAIIAYIRALQLSQNADPATLPEADKAQLQAAQ
jgi:mono/diheme cytochrome c family protein